MIDLHTHILPGLDDGPVNADFSLALARAAVEAGIGIVVATPHVRSDYPYDRDLIRERVALLNDRIAADELPLRVLAGAEVGWALLDDLDAAELARLTLGSSRYVLVESPYGRRPVELEDLLAGVHERGFRTILAHPERCPLFQRDPDRLTAIVAGGTLCSITAGSMEGRFGERVRRFTLELFARGLVHDVASDAHDHVHRPPELRPGFAAADEHIPGLAEHSAWYTVTVPVAILSGKPLPPAPVLAPPRPQRWRLRMRAR